MKKLVAVLLTLALLMPGAASSQASTVCTSSFPDVSRTNPACDPIERLLEAGILSGFPDGLFFPDDPTTRAQFAKMLVLSLGYSPKPNEYNRFHDTVSHWAATQGFLQVVDRLRAIDGFPDGTFRPDRTLTRAEAVKIASLAGGVTDGEQDFYQDVEGTWYEPYLRAAVAGRLIGPEAPTPLWTDPLFHGDQPITRAEAAMLLANMRVVLRPLITVTPDRGGVGTEFVIRVTGLAPNALVNIAIKGPYLSDFDHLNASPEGTIEKRFVAWPQNADPKLPARGLYQVDLEGYDKGGRALGNVATFGVDDSLPPANPPLVGSYIRMFAVTFGEAKRQSYVKVKPNDGVIIHFGLGNPSPYDYVTYAVKEPGRDWEVRRTLLFGFTSYQEWTETQIGDSFTRPGLYLLRAVLNGTDVKEATVEVTE